MAAIPEQDVRITTSPELPEEAWHPVVAGLIADGEVSSAELTTAYDTFIQCMEAAGVVGKYAYDVDRMGLGWAMEFAIPGEGRDSRLAERVEKRCYAQVVGPVEHLYTDRLSWPEREAIRRQSIIECLTEVDPAFSTIPDSERLGTLDSALYDQALREGGNESPTVECLTTLGVGWTEFQPTSHPPGQ